MRETRCIINIKVFLIDQNMLEKTGVVSCRKCHLHGFGIVDSQIHLPPSLSKKVCLSSAPLPQQLTNFFFLFLILFLFYIIFPMSSLCVCTFKFMFLNFYNAHLKHNLHFRRILIILEEICAQIIRMNER